MHYIEQCKEVFRPLLHDDAAFYYLHGAPTFPALRAAVLALGDLCGRTVIAELHVEDDEGHLPDGTDVRAAIGVLQRIGVTTVLISAHDPESLTQALEIAAPYARLSLGVHARGLAVSNHTVQHRGHYARHYGSICRGCAAIRWRAKRCRAIMMILSVRRTASTRILSLRPSTFRMRSSVVHIWMRISSKPRMIRVRLLLLETEEDVVTLEESRYMISRPLCLCAESADLLEQGLRVFPGLALYDGTWEQEDAVISYFETKYGMIRL